MISQYRGVLVIVVVLASVTVVLNGRMPIRPAHKAEIEMAITPSVAARLTGGYRNMMAVISWIRLISYYGGTEKNRRDYIYIARDLETIVAMNPRARSAYYMAGAALPWASHSTILARKLLSRAMQVFPDDWQWPYYLGFDIYFFEHDKAEAAHYLTIAAAKKGAPPVVTSLALRMQVSNNDLDTALAFIDQLMREKQDASMLKTLDAQRKAILTEKVLRHFDAILAKLPPAKPGENRLQRLKQYHVPIPARLPDGGHIVVDTHGRFKGDLVSSATYQRYQVYASPSYRNR